MSQDTLYDRLGLPRNASPEEIRRAYRDMARRLHPDRNVKPGETELFIDIQEAYEILSDQEKKEQYDKSLPPQSSIPPPLISSVQYSRNNLIQMPDAPQPRC
jgi:DnaJ-class molecular chaperone